MIKFKKRTDETIDWILSKIKHKEETLDKYFR